MTKPALSKKSISIAVKKEMGFSVASSHCVVNGLFEKMKEVLHRGEDIKIVRFGTFRMAERPERRGTDPSSGQTINIACQSIAVFNPSRTLKAKVNKIPPF